MARRLGTIVGICATFKRWGRTTKEGTQEMIARGAFTHAVKDDAIGFRVNHGGVTLATQASGALKLREVNAGLLAIVHLDLLRDRETAELIAGVASVGRATGWSVTFLRDSCDSRDAGRAWDGVPQVVHSKIDRLKEVSLLTPPHQPAWESWAGLLAPGESQACAPFLASVNKGSSANFQALAAASPTLARLRRQDIEALEQELGGYYIYGLSEELSQTGRDVRFLQTMRGTWIRNRIIDPRGLAARSLLSVPEFRDWSF